MISGMSDLRGGIMISWSCTVPLLWLACLGDDDSDVDSLESSPTLLTLESGISFFDIAFGERSFRDRDWRDFPAFRAVVRSPVPTSSSCDLLTGLDIVLTIAVLDDETKSSSSSLLNGSKGFSWCKEADLRGVPVTLYSVGCRVDRTLLLSDKATGDDRLLLHSLSSDNTKPSWDDGPLNWSSEGDPRAWGMGRASGGTTDGIGRVISSLKAIGVPGNWPARSCTACNESGILFMDCTRLTSGGSTAVVESGFGDSPHVAGKAAWQSCALADLCDSIRRGAETSSKGTKKEETESEESRNIEFNGWWKLGWGISHSDWGRDLISSTMVAGLGISNVEKRTCNNGLPWWYRTATRWRPFSARIFEKCVMSGSPGVGRVSYVADFSCMSEACWAAVWKDGESRRKVLKRGLEMISWNWDRTWKSSTLSEIEDNS